MSFWSGKFVYLDIDGGFRYIIVYGVILFRFVLRHLVFKNM